MVSTASVQKVPAQGSNNQQGFIHRSAQEWTMQTMTKMPETATRFSHIKPSDTPWTADGLRDFFLYRDLGVADATNGKVIAHLVKANKPPADGTGWHYHVCQFQIVLMTKGWARFMYDGVPTLVEAGDCVHQKPGLVHYLFDYSPDMEYLEIVSPADFGTVPVQGPDVEVPHVTPWK
jgi:hypothetical protein